MNSHEIRDGSLSPLLHHSSTVNWLKQRKRQMREQEISFNNVSQTISIEKVNEGSDTVINAEENTFSTSIKKEPSILDFTKANGIVIQSSQKSVSAHCKLFDDIWNESLPLRQNKLNFLRREQPLVVNSLFKGFSAVEAQPLPILKELQMEIENISKNVTNKSVNDWMPHATAIFNEDFSDLFAPNSPIQANTDPYPPVKVALGQTKDCSSGNTSEFYTASGRPLYVSQESFESAIQLYHSLNAESDEISKKINNTVGLGKSLRPMKMEENDFKSEFSTATGKALHVSEALLTSANRFYESLTTDFTEEDKLIKSNDINGETQLNVEITKSLTNDAGMSFCAAVENTVSISQECPDITYQRKPNMSNAMNVFTNKSLNTTKTNHLNNTDALLEGKIGFSTATGRLLQVSQKSLDAATRIYQSLDENTDICLDSITETSTELGKPLKTICTQSSNHEIGFSTASGSRLCVSQANLEAANRLYQSVENVTVSNHSVNKRSLEEENKENTLSKTLTSSKRVKVTEDNETPQRKKSLGVRPNKRVLLSADKIEGVFQILHKEQTSPLTKNPPKQMNERHADIVFQSPEKCDLNGFKQLLMNRKQLLQQQMDEISRKEAAFIHQSAKTSLIKMILPRKTKTLRNLTRRICNQSQFVVTPKNAIQFHFKSMDGSIINCDDMVVIPNVENLIGLNEFQLAFEIFLFGSQLPSNYWFKNHYKWIIWKLSSYQNNFPDLQNCLTVENVLKQLKLRYLREIVNGERSSLQRIVELKVPPQSRLILFISGISTMEDCIKGVYLSDGWYEVFTVIDDGLRAQIRKGTLRIGCKLVICGAELINSSAGGCHPLQISPETHLKISINSTRRAIWWASLGLQKISAPFAVPLHSILNNGGLISAIKVYVARVYPVKYMEKQKGVIVWRNEKAHLARQSEWEYERQKQIAMLTEQYQLDNTPKNLNSIQVTVEEKLSKLNLWKFDVSAVRKVRIVCTLNSTNRTSSAILRVWRSVTPEYWHDLTENAVLKIYNLLPKANGDLYTVPETRFQRLCTEDVHRFHRFQRTLTPIAVVTDIHNSSVIFNEFDTIGLVVKCIVEPTEQILWLADFVGRLLRVRIINGPKFYSLLNTVQTGRIVIVCNLLLLKPIENFGQAEANHYTQFNSNEALKYFQTQLKIFSSQLRTNTSKLLEQCNKQIDSNTKTQANSNVDITGENTIMDECLNDSSLIFTRTTSSDMVMSMMDIDHFL